LHKIDIYKILFIFIYSDSCLSLYQLLSVMIWDESGLLAICGTIVGLGAALLVQCGGNKRAPPKKAITAGSKAKSQRSVRGKKPSTSSKSLKTGKSAKSLRSARSASNVRHSMF
jgi:hypothetical protein